MKKLSETGAFTKQQQKWAKEIAIRIKKLRDSGCTVFAKQWSLNAYLNDEYDMATDMISEADRDNPMEVPYLECGEISDAGADDTFYFKEGSVIDDLDDYYED